MINLEYSGINSKIKAMNQKLLTFDDYSELASLSNVEEVGLRLKEYPAYRQHLENIELRRSYLEQRMILSLEEDYNSISKFVCDSTIKKYLRLYFGKFQIKQLATSKDAEELLMLLSDSPFAKVADNAAPGSTLFDLEMLLEQFYLTQLWAFVDRFFDKKNKTVLKEIHGVEIDLRNISCVYRMKAYYKVDTNQIYPLIIPIYNHLSVNVVSRMIEAPLSDLSLEIHDTYYGKFFSAQDIEQDIKQIMNRTYKNIAMGNTDSLALTMAYLYYKENEIKNIVSLIEGKRYGLDKAAVLEHLNLR